MGFLGIVKRISLNQTPKFKHMAYLKLLLFSFLKKTLQNKNCEVDNVTIVVQPAVAKSTKNKYKNVRKDEKIGNEIHKQNGKNISDGDTFPKVMRIAVGNRDVSGDCTSIVICVTAMKLLNAEANSLLQLSPHGRPTMHSVFELRKIAEPHS